MRWVLLIVVREGSRRTFDSIFDPSPTSANQLPGDISHLLPSIVVLAIHNLVSQSQYRNDIQ